MAVKHDLPNLSLGTVYRNLEQLVKAGLICQLEFPGGQKRFDGNTVPHHHFHCRKCGLVEDIPFHVPLPTVPDAGHPWYKERKIFHIYFGYCGLCPQCAGKNYPNRS